MNFSLINVFKKYGSKFYSLTEEFVPFLVENQYNSNLHKILEGPKTDLVSAYTRSHLDEDLAEFRPYSFITSDFCV